MAYSGLHSLVNNLIIRYDELTSEANSLMRSKTSLLKQSQKLTEKYNNAKNAIRAQYDSDSKEYEVEMDKINDEYDYSLAEITAWEQDMDMKKESIETEAKVVLQQKEDYQSMEKTNIKEDHKYFKGGGS